MYNVLRYWTMSNKFKKERGKKMKEKQMKLSETVELMCSENFKDRFLAEYLQLKIRLNGLNAMLEKYKNGTLDFKPKCSYNLLNAQRKVMEIYLSYLEERAEIENISIDNE